MLLTEITTSKTIGYQLLIMHKMLSEAHKPTKLGTEIDFDSIFDTPTHHDITKVNQSRDVKLTRAGREKTRKAVGNVRMDQKSAGLLADLQNSELEDTVGMRNPRSDTSNALTMNRSLKNKSNELSSDVKEPEWHKIEDLPGYMASAIRAMGRAIFSPLTNTDMEDIDVLANLNDSGPNTETELKLVGKYLLKNGTRNSESEIEFNKNVLRGYKADIQLWTAGNHEYLTVKDHAGQYIYSWPASDSKSFDLLKGRQGRLTP
ncbi:MAG: hypothetical protein ACXW2E_00450 [Nitrososphaeraceae archaeon]